MATFTEHYNFIKPGEEDYYDVQDFNENMDAIDGIMAQMETAAEGISEKIGSPDGTETVFSLLKENRIDEKICVPSETRQMGLQDISIVDTYISSPQMCKITDFTAPHDGMIRLCAQTTGQSGNGYLELFIFDCFPHAIGTAPDFSVIEPPSSAFSEVWKHPLPVKNETARIDFEMPVSKGRKYVFLFKVQRTESLTLDDFGIYYDESQI